MGLKRGDLAIVSAPGSYGKPRPAVIVQSDLYDGNGSLAVLLMTSHVNATIPLIRRMIQPCAANGLISPTDVMIDKIFTIPRDRIGQRFGNLTALEMTEITAALTLFLGV